MNDIEKRARELLAAEYFRDGRRTTAEFASLGLSEHRPAINAIIAALSGAPKVAQEGDYFEGLEEGVKIGRKEAVPEGWVLVPLELTDDRVVPEFAAPAAPQVQEAWQPIETAPRDGTRILVYCEHEDHPFPAYWYDHPRLCAWLAFKSHLTTDGDANVVEYFSQKSITHWMPLPEPPR